MPITHHFWAPLTLKPIKILRSQPKIPFGGVLTSWGPLGPELWTFQTFFNCLTHFWVYLQPFFDYDPI